MNKKKSLLLFVSFYFWTGVNIQSKENRSLESEKPESTSLAMTIKEKFPKKGALAVVGLTTLLFVRNNWQKKDKKVGVIGKNFTKEELKADTSPKGQQVSGLLKEKGLNLITKEELTKKEATERKKSSKWEKGWVDDINKKKGAFLTDIKKFKESLVKKVDNHRSTILFWEKKVKIIEKSIEACQKNIVDKKKEIKGCSYKKKEDTELVVSSLTKLMNNSQEEIEELNNNLVAAKNHISVNQFSLNSIKNRIKIGEKKIKIYEELVSEEWEEKKLYKLLISLLKEPSMSNSKKDFFMKRVKEMRQSTIEKVTPILKNIADIVSQFDKVEVEGGAPFIYN